MTKPNSLEQGVCIVRRSGGLTGRIRVPGDKSISHRAVMMSSLADGVSAISGFLESEDCIATLRAFEAMGVRSEQREDALVIHGRGGALSEPDDVLDMGNSGTGSRLLLGVLAGQDFCAALTGDASLRGRPMARVTEPLSRMGARFMGRDGGRKLPLMTQGGGLKGIEYASPVASAQIKSAILLAGLFAEGKTTIVEPGPSRDHTERMLRSYGVEVQSENGRVSLRGGQTLRTRDLDVPGDPSSAAFFTIGALITPESDLILENVGINPTRTGLYDVLLDMGADIAFENERLCGDEPVADLHVRHSPLRGVRVGGDTVVRMIDEFPIFSVAAAFAEGESTVEGAEELRVKESDRIAVMVGLLGRMGARIEERPDGFTVSGGAPLSGAQTDSKGDHRVAMSAAIAALNASGDTLIRGIAPIATSFPGFFDLLNQTAPGCAEVLE
ncbi:MAG: 3-phosphoshikimate 1-carboxyvinyltransferase [bacterium]|nr:3-phosphoshikimate 1-carboxyvinyltransferase [bacterium]